MFGLGWLLVLVLKPRFVPRGARPRIRNSVLATNVALAVIVVGVYPSVVLDLLRASLDQINQIVIPHL